jgi:hypothetical protein
MTYINIFDCWVYFKYSLNYWLFFLFFINRQTMVVLIQHRKLKIEQRGHHWKCGWTFGIKGPNFGRSNHPISINYFLLVVSIHNNLEHSLFERSVCLISFFKVTTLHGKQNFIFISSHIHHQFIYLSNSKKKNKVVSFDRYQWYMY